MKGLQMNKRALMCRCIIWVCYNIARIVAVLFVEDRVVNPVANEQPPGTNILERLLYSSEVAGILHKYVCACI